MTLTIAGAIKEESVRIDFAKRATKRIRLQDQTLANEHVHTLKHVIATFLQGQKPLVIAEAKRILASLQKSDAIITLDWSALASQVTPFLADTHKKASTKAFDQTGASGPFNQVNELADAYARDRAAELVGMKWVDGELVENPNADWAITDTTRNNIRDLIDRAVREGMTPDQLATEIEESSDFSEYRAEMVARTELASAQTEGALTGWRESGVVSGKEWLLSGEHGDPDECDDNADAGVIALEDDFPSGDDAPPAHPYCYCDVVAVLEEMEEEEAA